MVEITGNAIILENPKNPQRVGIIEYTGQEFIIVTDQVVITTYQNGGVIKIVKTYYTTYKISIVGGILVSQEVSTTTNTIILPT